MKHLSVLFRPVANAFTSLRVGSLSVVLHSLIGGCLPQRNVSAMCTVAVGSPSAHRRSLMLKPFAFMLLFLVSSVNVWGENQNFTITFKANGGTQDGSAALTATTFMNQVTEGADSISSVSPTYCYSGIEALKVSANKNNGSFTLTLAHSLSINKVVLNVKNKNATVKSVTVGSSAFSTTDTWSTTEFSDLEFTGTETNSNQVTIALNGTSNSARVAYLHSITIYHTVSGGGGGSSEPAN